jgi:uncharacterized protein (TIGR00369 family)
MTLRKIKIRTSKGMKDYTYLGCPLTRNRTPWCFRMCVPDPEGKGECGRIAPHSFKSRIQKGIEAHNREKMAAHFARLERMYINGPNNEYYNPGIRVTEGEAEVVIPVQEKFFHAANGVHGSVYFKALDDAAFFAVNSLVERVFVLTVSFNVEFSRPVSKGELVARGRYLGRSGRHYLAEAVLMDAEGNEIAKGSGAFVESRTRLSKKIGYE